MRLKTYHAPTMNEAMQLIREQLGPDAIIVATHDDDAGRGVRVTAAMEETETEEVTPSFDAIDVVCEALDKHQTAQDLSERLINIASDLNETDPVLCLAAALDDTFKFSPLPDHGPAKPLVFIGPPGVGKTVCVAKLAARARLAGHEAYMVTIDTVRAGAIEQLGVYADRLGLSLTTSAQGASLASLVKAGPKDALILVDTPGANPYDPGDIKILAHQIGGIDCETILVMDAGRSALEAIDIVRAFRDLNPSRLLVTGLDLVKRLGGMLALSEACDLPFCGVSPSPAIADGLHPINPVSLARLLMPQTGQDQHRVDRADATRTG